MDLGTTVAHAGMSLVASSISGAAYVLGNSEEKDTGNGFEVRYPSGAARAR